MFNGINSNNRYKKTGYKPPNNVKKSSNNETTALSKSVINNGPEKVDKVNFTGNKGRILSGNYSIDPNTKRKIKLDLATPNLYKYNNIQITRGTVADPKHKMKNILSELKKNRDINETFGETYLYPRKSYELRRDPTISPCTFRFPAIAEMALGKSQATPTPILKNYCEKIHTFRVLKLVEENSTKSNWFKEAEFKNLSEESYNLAGKKLVEMFTTKESINDRNEIKAFLRPMGFDNLNTDRNQLLLMNYLTKDNFNELGKKFGEVLKSYGTGKKEDQTRQKSINEINQMINGGLIKRDFCRDLDEESTLKLSIDSKLKEQSAEEFLGYLKNNHKTGMIIKYRDEEGNPFSHYLKYLKNVVSALDNQAKEKIIISKKFDPQLKLITSQVPELKYPEKMQHFVEVLQQNVEQIGKNAAKKDISDFQLVDKKGKLTKFAQAIIARTNIQVADISQKTGSSTPAPASEKTSPPSLKLDPDLLEKYNVLIEEIKNTGNLVEKLQVQPKETSARDNLEKRFKALQVQPKETSELNNLKKKFEELNTRYDKLLDELSGKICDRKSSQGWLALKGPTEAEQAKMEKKISDLKKEYSKLKNELAKKGYLGGNNPFRSNLKSSLSSPSSRFEGFNVDSSISSESSSLSKKSNLKGSPVKIINTSPKNNNCYIHAALTTLRAMPAMRKQPIVKKDIENTGDEIAAELEKEVGRPKYPDGGNHNIDIQSDQARFVEKYLEKKLEKPVQIIVFQVDPTTNSNDITHSTTEINPRALQIPIYHSINHFNGIDYKPSGNWEEDATTIASGLNSLIPESDRKLFKEVMEQQYKEMKAANEKN